MRPFIVGDERRRSDEILRGVLSAFGLRGAVETAIAEIEGVLETFNALLRIGQVEAGARRAAFRGRSRPQSLSEPPAAYGSARSF